MKIVLIRGWVVLQMYLCCTHTHTHTQIHTHMNIHIHNYSFDSLRRYGKRHKGFFKENVKHICKEM